MEGNHDHVKRLLRARLRAARRALPSEVVIAASAAAAQRILELPGFVAARHVVAYIPVEREIDPGAVVTTAKVSGKCVYYPRRTGGTLEFLAAEPHTFRHGPGGIPEPVAGVPLPHEPAGTLFLVPGLAFDLRCVRLGRGAGGYDRALAAHPDALRIGVAYDFQVLPLLPAAPWDIPMHAVATEARLVGEGAG